VRVGRLRKNLSAFSQPYLKHVEEIEPPVDDSECEITVRAKTKPLIMALIMKTSQNKLEGKADSLQPGLAQRFPEI
jgi:hypothetical protein